MEIFVCKLCVGKNQRKIMVLASVLCSHDHLDAKKMHKHRVLTNNTISYLLLSLGEEEKRCLR